MHKLARQVRFSINPFLPEDSKGFNSFCSMPAGQGLSIFLELCVGLIGEVNPATGFVVNVTDVDKCVRQYVVPIFAEKIKRYFRQGQNVGFLEIAGLLESAQEQLTGRFDKALVGELSLKLNPFRKAAIDCEDKKMIYISEKFDFAAMHKLWNDDFSKSRNFEVFGKCANPAGHGHNYVIEVTVKMPRGGDVCISDFEKTVDNELIEIIDHKNLNTDVAYFEKFNPTVENITVFAWERIVDKFSEVKLHCVTVWETDKTCCSYYG